ncbi:MAG: hypothetical protein HY894_02000 [Deltaproteobacteria bacterium]|nr:hypothetical protein [Deltaproteobacteria bacterium]
MKALTILGILFSLFIPIVILLWKEWKPKKAGPGRDGAPAKTAEPFDAAMFARVSAVLAALAVPVFFLSETTFSFYPKDAALLRVAFKHSGKRIVDCDETALIKQAGERYRESIKEAGRVKMNNEMMKGCPRERYPVAVDVAIDGGASVSRSYKPTGIRKDMASYVYDEYIISPGVHRIAAGLWDTAKGAAPDYAFDETVNVAARQVLLIRLDDAANRLVIE